MSTIQIDRLLDTVVKQGASDLHLTVGRRPCLRKSSRLVDLQTKVLDADDMVTLMKSITPERSSRNCRRKAARLRLRVRRRGPLPCVGVPAEGQPGHRAAPDPQPNPDVRADRSAPICRDLIRRPRGLFLVTGPTGSGKTTSLATMIDYINMNLDRHIITIEDPIEYYHKSQAVDHQPARGRRGYPSFAEALRRALRQDPDVILVGEMRDLETIEAAMRAAETGHLVFGTLHTTGAAGRSTVSSTPSR
jgi:twitching motility protein PilT